MNKIHLYPQFPPLPVARLAGFGGYYGALVNPGRNVNNQRHNLYEEIPCMGVLAEAIRQSLSNAGPGRYQSNVTFNGQQPNRNLLGFRPLGHRRPEPKNLAFEQGITDLEFPSYPNNYAFNIDLLIEISNVLAKTKTFKNTDTVFSTLTEVGAQSQIIFEIPQLTADNAEQSALLGELAPRCLNKESESIFGSGVFFAQQLMKVSVANEHRSWSMFNVIPQEWVDNRNDRRDLPQPFHFNGFCSVSQMASTFRKNVIKTIVTTKR
ncbi:unnamed protein product [Phaedon cochleariae]|uniref:Uncharacterized protein n=1 Tax=Phaedon cochleariae TaxID=80249 RepID=A0A9N9X473_PHACE|nr:unnamed protein product [Phaedon cochleariae]